MPVEFLPCGDCAFSVQFGDRIDRDLSRRVMALHAALGERRLPGLIETVPTFRSLMVHYDPLETSQAELRTLIEPLTADARQQDTTTAAAKCARLRLPVCYDPAFASDLTAVAASAGVSPQEVVALHSSAAHYVYMIGFAPGQPYMGDLPEALVLPRREDPRAEVAVGTVAIATGLSVVYPFANPCGWHVIGRTPVPMFDQTRTPPILVAAGDMITCYPITVEEFERLQAEIAAGRYQFEEAP